MLPYCLKCQTLQKVKPQKFKTIVKPCYYQIFLYVVLKMKIHKRQKKSKRNIKQFRSYSTIK